MTVPVIIGYGHAGRDLHHRSLCALDAAATVLVVDPVDRGDTMPGGLRRPDIAAAVATLDSPAAGVFHVATPAACHLAAVRELATLGARHVIVEKPLAATRAQARELVAVAARAGMRLVPMSVWPASAVTRHVVRLLADGRIGRLASLCMAQHKPRFQRGRDDPAHHSAFEIELPHQVLLALLLCGPPLAIENSAGWPLVLPDRVRPDLGGALVRLRHADGRTSTLVTDLTAPVRMRRLRLVGTDGEIVAHYPVTGDDHFGQVWASGDRSRTLLPDAPLTEFIASSYRYFRGAGERTPGSDPDLHIQVMDILAAAARRAVTVERAVTEYEERKVSAR